MSRWLGSCLVVLIVVGVASPAGAAGIDRLATDGVVSLQAEIMLIAELGAFEGELPPAVVEIHGDWRSYAAGMSRTQLVGWLLQADAEGAAIVERLRAAGVQPSAATAAALGALPAEDVRAVEAGGTISIAPQAYADAWFDLSARHGEAPSGASPVPGAAGSEGEPAPEREPGSHAASVPASPGLPVVPIGLAAAGVGAVGAVALARRRRAPTVAGAQMERLLEAGRRMTKALDRTEIARIAGQEAAAVTGARHAGFVHAAGDVARVEYESSEGLLDVRRVGEGIVGRVLETGQAARAVVHDEPALTALPVSIVAVPVIGSGRMTGVLLVVRPPERPFSAREQEALERLAPMVGSALDAAAQHTDVTELTMTDGLTGCANRRRLDRDLPEALEWSTATRGRVGFVMIDVDHFKAYNDRQGHAAGDRALRTVAEVLRRNVREGDVVYRYGGEEFSVLLKDTTDEEAAAIAERLRAAVEASAFPGEEGQPDGRVTISVGLCVATEQAPDDVVASADRALYEAKETGRNRVVTADPLPPPV